MALHSTQVGAQILKMVDRLVAAGSELPAMSSNRNRGKNVTRALFPREAKTDACGRVTCYHPGPSDLEKEYAGGDPCDPVPGLRWRNPKFAPLSGSRLRLEDEPGVKRDTQVAGPILASLRLGRESPASMRPAQITGAMQPVVTRQTSIERASEGGSTFRSGCLYRPMADAAVSGDSNRSWTGPHSGRSSFRGCRWAAGAAHQPRRPTARMSPIMIG